ncbi:TetR/AcrR family transcriptional regulator [Cryptosporangium aurantiacum]|uniref:Transcriptional regulator, TetR family n=1 Tax=Cryptosporangium aurantiacum TaxID=134849 RepID=A0A1M7RG69_9ACTN|nr:TetR/AcrR family transcriptional regulator [Cryptosporangium aurantiacum]SHN45273.1 transcriptional regulator, TetR family [Cryptosporangium aurantiacum]
MTSAADNGPAWLDRAADRSPAVQRSRDRSARRAAALVDAAHRLMTRKGSAFTTQELVKEAGVALQTFYRHFAGKDQLLLAVFERIISEEAARSARAARRLKDPVDRLRLHVTEPFTSLRGRRNTTQARFMTAEHWRLYQLFPDEMNRARQAYTDLIEQALRTATAAGRLSSTDPAKDAWLINQLVTSAYHHFSFAEDPRRVDEIVDQLWTFCLAAVGGRPEVKGPTDGRREGLSQGP